MFASIRIAATHLLMKEDRRVQRTRQMLAHAFIGLMVERGYDQVTVQDILDRSGVGRSTFYLHFKSKEALLRACMEFLSAEIERAWRVALDSDQTKPGQLGFVLPYLRHVENHRPIYRARIGTESEPIIDRHTRKMFLDLARKDLAGRTDLELRAQFAVGAITSIVTWWLESDAEVSAESMSERLVALALNGVA